MRAAAAGKATPGFLPWKEGCGLAAGTLAGWDCGGAHLLSLGMIWRELHKMFDSLETGESAFPH